LKRRPIVKFALPSYFQQHPDQAVQSPADETKMSEADPDEDRTNK
jgi:hypothetical protein